MIPWQRTKKLTCIARTIKEYSMLEVQLVENIHGEELSPVKEAMTFGP